MKILHLLQSNRFSGAENVVCQIIGMFRNEPGIEMIYCSSDGQIREALAERNITFVGLKNISVKEVRQVIREQKPDIIHTHDMRASFVAACACGSIPLISHIHNNNFNSRGLSVKSIAYLFAALKAKHIFWVSQSSFDGYAFHKWFRKKSSVLYNIIDIDSLYQKMETDSHTYDYDVIYVGRLSYPKNPQRLMRVFGKVREICPNIKIAVVGTGELEAATKDLCNELNLQGNVHFLGFQSNPLKMLHDSKVMIMTSRWEGTPMCALEAMALGVPIVSTPVDGLKVLVKNGENGYLSDDNSELANRIADIINNTQTHNIFSTRMRKMSVEINDREKYMSVLMEQYINAKK